MEEINEETKETDESKGQKKKIIKEQSSMTRSQIKLCIQKLDSIARQKNQSFKKTIDELFAVNMDDRIKAPETADLTPEEHFKEMLLQINLKYGELITAADVSDNLIPEVNEFIDQLAHEVQYVIEDPEANPQCDN